MPGHDGEGQRDRDGRQKYKAAQKPVAMRPTGMMPWGPTGQGLMRDGSIGEKRQAHAFPASFEPHPIF